MRAWLHGRVVALLVVTVFGPLHAVHGDGCIGIERLVMLTFSVAKRPRAPAVAAAFPATSLIALSILLLLCVSNIPVWLITTVVAVVVATISAILTRTIIAPHFVIRSAAAAASAVAIAAGPASFVMPTIKAWAAGGTSFHVAMVAAAAAGFASLVTATAAVVVVWASVVVVAAIFVAFIMSTAMVVMMPCRAMCIADGLLITPRSC